MAVKFEMDGAVAIATFDDPPMNLITEENMDGYWDAAQQALSNKARAFLTLSAGDHFCAGADVHKAFVGQNSSDGRRFLAKAFQIIQGIERLPIPTVIAVRGLCLGGGCEIMQLHDIVFAGEGAGIGQIEAQIATSTLLGGASRLVSKVGVNRAKEIVFSADVYDAKTMYNWGMVNKIFPDDTVEAEARAYAQKLAEGPTIAYRYSKALINTAAAHGVAAADALALESLPSTFDTDDMQKATKSFVERGARKFRDGLTFTGA